MQTNLLIELEKNPIIELKAKNTWLPGYSVAFNFKENSFSDCKGIGTIPVKAKAEFYKVLADIESVPEPVLPTRHVKIDCVYDLNLFGRQLQYTNYTFQINPQLTQLQRALLLLADSCGIKVY